VLDGTKSSISVNIRLQYTFSQVVTTVFTHPSSP
jgi:hypothetical protein